MSSHPIRLKQLLHKYLRNEISAEELREFWQLMNELNEDDLVDEELARFWHDPSLQAENTADWDALYGRLQRKAAAQDIDYDRILYSRRRRTRQWAVAASILLVCALSYLFVFQQSGQKAGEPVLTSKSTYDLQVLQLPDGTSVTLNHNSRLDYPATFDGATREVYLFGEAFFDVNHDPAKPFIVHTGTLITRVLGTAFNIRAYAQDSQVAVTVSRGKVQVQQGNEKVLGLLTAGDQLVVSKEEQSAVKSKVDVGAILHWKVRELLFDNKTIDEAALTIGNYYGVKIRFESEALRKCRFTARFSGAEEDIGEVMEVITTLTGASWKRDSADVIILSGKGCN